MKTISVILCNLQATNSGKKKKTRLEATVEFKHAIKLFLISSIKGINKIKGSICANSKVGTNSLSLDFNKVSHALLRTADHWVYVNQQEHVLQYLSYGHKTNKQKKKIEL